MVSLKRMDHLRVVGCAFLIHGQAVNYGLDRHIEQTLISNPTGALHQQLVSKEGYLLKPIHTAAVVKWGLDVQDGADGVSEEDGPSEGGRLCLPDTWPGGILWA